MRTIYEYLCRYTVRTRVIAMIILFVTSIFASLAMLAHAETTNNDAWILGSVLLLFVFMIVISEILISIEEQAWERAGLQGGMYFTASKKH